MTHRDGGVHGRLPSSSGIFHTVVSTSRLWSWAAHKVQGVKEHSQILALTLLLSWEDQFSEFIFSMDPAKEAAMCFLEERYGIGEWDRREISAAWSSSGKWGDHQFQHDANSSTDSQGASPGWGFMKLSYCNMYMGGLEVTGNYTWTGSYV